MNLITRTYHSRNDTKNIRKSQRVSKKPKFLDEYVIDDYEDNTQHPDMDNVVGTTENNDIRIVFDRLISFVEQWQQELIDIMEKVDHDGDAILSIIINKHVTNYSSSEFIIYLFRTIYYFMISYIRLMLIQLLLNFVQNSNCY